MHVVCTRAERCGESNGVLKIEVPMKLTKILPKEVEKVPSLEI